MASITTPRPANSLDLGPLITSLRAPIEWLDDLVIFYWQVAKAIFSRPFERAEFLSQLDDIGARSLPLVSLAGAGEGIGAELGSMRLTEQIDAMETSAFDPHKFLVATKVLACMVALPMLTVAANFFGVLMAWAASTLVDPVSLKLLLQNGFHGAIFSDLLPPIFKNAVFGLIVVTDVVLVQLITTFF